MRSAAIAAVCLAMCVAGSARAQGLQGSCTVVDAPGVERAGYVIDHSEEPPLKLPIARRAVVGPKQEVQTAEGASAAIFLRSSDGSAEASLYLTSETAVHVCPEGDQRDRLELLNGEMVVSYAARATNGQQPSPLIVSTEGTWVRLENGGTLIGKIGVDEPTVSFDLVAGEARQFDGAVPDGELPAVGGRELRPQPGRRSEVLQLGRSLSDALLREVAAKWVEDAERGDLVPTGQPDVAPREASVVPTPSAPVDQTALAQPVSVSPVSVAVPGADGTTRTESLLASGNPASVLVGRRLERTRIIGSPGAPGATTNLQFNREARRPLQLTQGR